MHKRVAEEELTRLRAHRDYRDKLAMRIGVEVWAMVRTIREIEGMIEVSVAEEGAMHGQVLQRHGVPAGFDASIDYETGVIVEPRKMKVR